MSTLRLAKSVVRALRRVERRVVRRDGLGELDEKVDLGEWGVGGDERWVDAVERWAGMVVWLVVGLVK